MFELNLPPNTSLWDELMMRCLGLGRVAGGAVGQSLGEAAAAYFSGGLSLQDATRVTADRPDVVSSLPASRRRTPVTANPLHRKLPRP